MTLRPAAPADAVAIAGLEESFPVGHRWSETAWLEEIEAGDRLVLVSCDGPEVVAVAAWRAAFDAAELYRVIVTPTRRRLGLAGELMIRGLAWARRQGVERVVLEVALDNDPAISLYRGHGFAPVARRADYYGRGRDALIMELPLVKEEPS